MARRKPPPEPEDALTPPEERRRDDEAILEYNQSTRSGRLQVGGWNAHVLIVSLGIGIVLACVALVLASIAYLAIGIGFRLSDLGMVLWLGFCFGAAWLSAHCH